MNSNFLKTKWILLFLVSFNLTLVCFSFVGGSEDILELFGSFPWIVATTSSSSSSLFGMLNVNKSSSSQEDLNTFTLLLSMLHCALIVLCLLGIAIIIRFYERRFSNSSKTNALLWMLSAVWLLGIIVASVIPIVFYWVALPELKQDLAEVTIELGIAFWSTFVVVAIFAILSLCVVYQWRQLKAWRELNKSFISYF